MRPPAKAESSPRRPADRVRRRPGPLRRGAVLAAAALTAGLLAPTTPGLAAPAVPAAPSDTEAKLAKLEKQAKALAKDYRGELVALTEARKAAEKASGKADGVRRELRAARDRTGDLAAEAYKSSGVDPSLQLAFAKDPVRSLNDAAAAEHLAERSGEQVRQLNTLVAERRAADADASEKLKAAERKVDELKKRRAKVAALVEKYTPEAPSSGVTASSNGDHPPYIGMEGITSRMAKVRDAVVARYGGKIVSVGCYRADGGGGEHPLGRACDFMLSSGGSMPSGEMAALGDSISQHAIDNADGLGVMYVIYKQRIYDMRSPGWDPMEDRGSATANHYDHVHISVF
ncbi:MAG: hypothetical protein GEV11_25510 [Streptosporangiales bacterium]|nr:hypothetical protein [Streptosporangiales bacterium]